MERDAVSAGVSKHGGLFNTAEIKILVCYIISSINEPVPGKMLSDTLHYEGIANVFEVNTAIASLSNSGHLKLVDEKDDTYIATKSGKEIAQTLKTSLPLIVKDRAYNATIKMLAQFKNTKETDIEITKENDKTFITCTAKDNDQPFMSVKLLVADEEQAIFIKKKFLSDGQIYSKIIELLTKK